MTDPFSQWSALQACTAVTEAELGVPLGEWMAEGPAEQLTLTEYAQPALVVLGYAVATELMSRGLTVTGAAGHSLGEITALAAAGAIDFPDAVQLAHKRGAAMQAAVPEGKGGMAALLGIDEATLKKALDQANNHGQLVAANFNAPGHVVVSGDVAALEFIAEQKHELGIRRVVRLDVSAPFHSPMMQPAADQLASMLEKIAISRPAFPVWSNADLALHSTPTEIRRALVRQVTAPVRWQQQVEKMACRAQAIELPPGNVLKGLSKRIKPDWPVVAIDHPVTAKKALEMAA